MATEIRPEDSVSQRSASHGAFPGIPQFAEDHAPLLHLHPDDRYRPTDLSTFLSHVRPQIDFKDVEPITPIPTLASLDEWNVRSSKQGEDIFLTSYDDITTGPAWLDGVHELGSNSTDRTGAIIVVEKGEGVVDVFYFVFWAFNYGGIVLGKNLGNHVGDWEHVMIRFKDSVPTAVWLSQHGNGEAYTFSALQKDSSGKRPIVYTAKGSHAIYARTGPTDHTIPNFNTSLPLLLVDHCAPGPQFDPLQSSHAYWHSPVTAALAPAVSPLSPASNPPPKTPPPSPLLPLHFTPLTPSSPAPGWLLFTGHWGDASYPRTDRRQSSLFRFRKYDDGPTGPAFKDLGREKVWPANSYAGGQILRTGVGARARVRDLFRRWGGGLRCLGAGRERVRR